MKGISEFYSGESEVGPSWEDLAAIEEGVWIFGLLPGVDFIKDHLEVDDELQFTQTMGPGALIRRHDHKFVEVFETISGLHRDNSSGVIIPPGKRIKFRSGTPHEIENITPDGGEGKATVKFYKR